MTFCPLKNKLPKNRKTTGTAVVFLLQTMFLLMTLIIMNSVVTLMNFIPR